MLHKCTPGTRCRLPKLTSDNFLSGVYGALTSTWYVYLFLSWHNHGMRVNLCAFPGMHTNTGIRLRMRAILLYFRRCLYFIHGLTSAFFDKPIPGTRQVIRALLALLFVQDISDSDMAEPIEFTSAIYMAAMMLSTVGEGVYGPVPVSPLARVAASVAVLFFLPLAAIRVSRRFCCAICY